MKFGFRSPSLILFLLILFTVTAANGQSARVVGDKEKKEYRDFQCAESRLVPLKASITFQNAETAEQAGYTRAADCSQPVLLPAERERPDPESMKLRDLRSRSDSLQLVTGDIDKYRYKNLRLIGDLDVSDLYTGDFEARKDSHYSFRFYDATGGLGYFYIVRNADSELLRKQAVSTERLTADCRVRILGLGFVDRPFGDLLSCTFWRPED